MSRLGPDRALDFSQYDSYGARLLGFPKFLELQFMPNSKIKPNQKHANGESDISSRMSEDISQGICDIYEYAVLSWSLLASFLDKASETGWPDTFQLGVFFTCPSSSA